MYTFVIRSLLKSDVKLNFPKSLIRWYSRNQNIKSSTNHYDTLKITPHATHSEIKSAYYKLSLQYHPDKNKSEHAKQKFQDISEAYEILNNYELRKNYDQRMKIQQPSVSTTAKPRYKEEKVYTRPTKLYNFDAWIQAHYGRQMEITREMKRGCQQLREEKQERKQATTNPLVTFVTFILTLLVLMPLSRQNMDLTHSERIKQGKRSS